MYFKFPIDGKILDVNQQEDGLNFKIQVTDPDIVARKSSFVKIREGKIKMGEFKFAAPKIDVGDGDFVKKLEKVGSAKVGDIINVFVKTKVKFFNFDVSGRFEDFNYYDFLQKFLSEMGFAIMGIAIMTEILFQLKNIVNINEKEGG